MNKSAITQILCLDETETCVRSVAGCDYLIISYYMHHSHTHGDLILKEALPK
jgi:tRNA (Thr-GGU) A37 N-methylase